MTELERNESTEAERHVRKSEEPNNRDDSATVPPLPPTGMSTGDILRTLRRYRADDVPTSGGRTTAYVYDSGLPGLEELGVEAYAISQPVNGLDPTAFPSFARVENDLVAAAAQLLGGDAHTAGTATSGGTESCALAVLGARERWR